MSLSFCPEVRPAQQQPGSKSEQRGHARAAPRQTPIEQHTALGARGVGISEPDVSRTVGSTERGRWQRESVFSRVAGLRVVPNSDLCSLEAHKIVSGESETAQRLRARVMCGVLTCVCWAHSLCALCLCCLPLPRVHPEASKFMVGAFHKYAAVWPCSLLGWSGDQFRVVSGTLMVSEQPTAERRSGEGVEREHRPFAKLIASLLASRSFGCLQGIFGLLVLCPRYTRLSALMFMMFMFVAAWSTMILQEPFVPALVFLALSTVLFVVAEEEGTHTHAKKEMTKKMV